MAYGLGKTGDRLIVLRYCSPIRRVCGRSTAVVEAHIKKINWRKARDEITTPKNYQVRIHIIVGGKDLNHPLLSAGILSPAPYIVG